MNLFKECKKIKYWEDDPKFKKNSLVHTANKQDSKDLILNLPDSKAPAFFSFNIVVYYGSGMFNFC